MRQLTRTCCAGSRVAARIAAILVVSIIVPLLVAAGSFARFVQGKPLGYRSAIVKHYQSGAVRNGELWFLSSEAAGCANDDYRNHSLIRLDLKTGVEHSTPIVIPCCWCGPVWIGDVLYLITEKEIRITNRDGRDTSAIPLPGPRTTSIFPHHPRFLFDYDGQLTSIVEPVTGELRLVHFVNNQWINGRRLRLPDGGRVWHDDRQRERLELVPLTAVSVAPSAIRVSHGMQSQLEVIQQGSQTHLLFSVYPDFCAYRSGFEFDDEESEEASALVPENSQHEVSRWQTVSSLNAKQEIFDQMQCDQFGPVFFAWGEEARCVRRHADGRWVELELQPNHWGKLLADPEAPDAYILDSRAWYSTWGAAIVRRIAGDRIEPIHLRLPGMMDEYLARWRQLEIGLLVAWLVHYGIVLLGAAWVTRRVSAPEYFSGSQQASLAPLWRRASALAVDLAIAIVVVSLAVWISVSWVPLELMKQCDKLFEYEQDPRKLLKSPLSLFFQEPVSKSWLLTVLTLTGTALLIQRVIQEGYCGTTPGKRRLGIRTVRTTLRPAGVARTLLRTVLYAVDLANLVTPLPAAFSIMLSSDRRRLGDRAADTIVVMADSICEASRRQENAQGDSTQHPLNASAL